MAAAAAPPVPAEGAGERLAAELQGLGDALRLAAQAGLLPEEVQELVGSWDVRTQALVGALTGGAEGGQLQEAEATAAADLLRPLLSEASVADHPDLFHKTLEVGRSISGCFSEEAFPLYFGPVGASMLGLFLSERLSVQTQDFAAGFLAGTLRHPGCAAAVLAVVGAEGAADALIAAAKREGDPRQGRAFLVLAELAGADEGVRERAASADAALLPVAVALMSAAAAGAAEYDSAVAFQGPLLLISKLIIATAPASVRARALATPGLAAAAIDLLMALGSEAWAAVREDWATARMGRVALWEEPEADIVTTLALLLHAGGAACASTVDALASRGALPRVLALLRSPCKGARLAASFCICNCVDREAGCDALFLVPRAASELTAALRRAHADGEDPSLTQFRAAHALVALQRHSQGARIAEGLVHAALAEGSAGSLLGALAGLLEAGMDGAGFLQAKQNMMVCATALLAHMVAAAEAKQLRLVPVMRRAPLAEACVCALRHSLGEASEFHMPLILVQLVAIVTGFEHSGTAHIPAATVDTAAVRAALREAPGMEGGLRRFLAWAQRQPLRGALKDAVPAAKWLLRLPEVKAPAAAAVSHAAAASTSAATTTAAAAVGATADPAAAAPTTSPVPSAAATASPPAAARLPAEQPRDSSSASGGGSGEAAAQPRACGGCGKSEPEVRLLRCAGCKAQYYCGAACARAHWPSHRAACKAAVRRATAAERS